MTSPPLSADVIRGMFSQALSDMYQSEAPRYRALMNLVASVNSRVLAADPDLKARLLEKRGLDRLSLARHGAIRVGTARELFTLRRLFAVMGMAPVGYYDLSGSGLPVHSTAFRPVTPAALQANPFRMFASLLRLELIRDAALREEAAAILARRDIFTPRCRELLDLHDKIGGFDETIAREFVAEALETFRFHRQAATPEDVYRRLFAAHPLIADIVCFRGPHINHLTLTALDIDAAQQALAEQGMAPKAIIEGPPRRRCPILLRQTSYKAQAEPVSFDTMGGAMAEGAHAARFGEIEQRAAALTAKGRSLYDRLLGETLASVTPAGDGSNAQAYAQELVRRFAAFPDDHVTLRSEKLAFFRYTPTTEGLRHKDQPRPETLDELLRRGHIEIEPILYEDFLPASAAGIFRSNLGDDAAETAETNSNRQALEAALGEKIVDEIALYQQEETQSLEACLLALGLPVDAFSIR
ncbi:MAG TPA: VOC family protein [Methylocystis sp.]|nr:VOC family protein [Methylocystis sp.]